VSEIELRDVSKVFDDDVVAVDDVSITIEDGELVVLVGPSGSGKSTTLRIIAGLERPTSGDVLINGERVNDVEPQDRDIAMVFQSFALYPHRTVRGNIAFPLQARDMSKSEVKEHVQEAADLLDIPELLDRKPSQLSGGQQQRVALGRAIVRDPRAFLMDEPLANLDAKLRKEMRTEVVRLQQNLGVTMIHVTHNQEEAMTMGDRVAIMNHGEVQQLAPPKEAYRKPANRFVAEFMGSPSMNLIEGTIADEIFEVSDSTVSLQLPERLVAATDQDLVTLGVRPEDAELIDSPDGYTFTGEVDVVESLGNVQVVHVTAEATEFLVETDPDRDIEPGEMVHVRLSPEKIHLFDGTKPESERVEPQVEPVPETD